MRAAAVAAAIAAAAAAAVAIYTWGWRGQPDRTAEREQALAAAAAFTIDQEEGVTVEAFRRQAPGLWLVDLDNGTCLLVDVEEFSSRSSGGFNGLTLTAC